ncbi:MAG: insulinase family protein, partial [Clostridia bacterium]|nr:insulinase family protein [Clostridia bacterium]
MEKIAEICGIEFYYIENNVFKSDTVAVNFCDRLDRARAYKNALLPALLWRGSKKYTTSKALTVRCQELYGSIVLTDVGKRSEIQHMMFMTDFLKEEYAEACGNDDTGVSADEIEEEAFSLLLDIITNPVTENGGFLESYFRQECINLNNDILAEKNDKQHYAMRRCREVMCENEAFGLSELGELTDGENLTSKELYEYYREYFLKKIQCKVFYCGRSKPDKLIELFRRAAETGVFGDGNRENAYTEYVEKKVILPENVKYVTENYEIQDGKLVMGFRTNTDRESDDFFALVLMNTVYGGGTSSKLFRNVREKNSLAYYAGSRVSAVKGIMI